MNFCPGVGLFESEATICELFVFPLFRLNGFISRHTFFSEHCISIDIWHFQSIKALGLKVISHSIACHFHIFLSMKLQIRAEFGALKPKHRTFAERSQVVS